MTVAKTTYSGSGKVVVKLAGTEAEVLQAIASEGVMAKQILHIATDGTLCYYIKP